MRKMRTSRVLTMRRKKINTMKNNEQLIITKAENGFIIGGGDTPTEKNRTQVAKTLDEVVAIVSDIINQNIESNG